jgi:tRNA wybutosine-synthesizing protein 4
MVKIAPLIQSFRADHAARFSLLEQILPAGIDHPFAQTMMAHFTKLNTPLRAVQKYPTTLAQEERFKGLGWSRASARNLWHLWNDSDFIAPQERMLLDVLEPFDEWEEFALFGSHYFLLVANTSATTPGFEFSGEDPLSSDNSFSSRDYAHSVKLDVSFSENPKTQGCRRFGAVLPLRGSNRSEDRVALFGGMGLHTRTNTYDVYSMHASGGILADSRAISAVPSSRMCHSITDIGDAGALLVGGRTSPDNAFADCWLYHKWLDTWERVDNLPVPTYRHGAVSLGQGYVLIAPGKTNSRNVSTDFYVWSRTLGWVKCLQGPGEKPIPSYGATFTVSERSPRGSMSSCGMLAGGMSEGGLLLKDVWEWELCDLSSQVRTQDYAITGPYWNS